MSDRRTIDDLLREARQDVKRLTPREAADAVAHGATLVDTRSAEDRARDGVVPGSVHAPLSVLEWRVDPASGHQAPELKGREHRMVLLCAEGYSSSLAAARLRSLGFPETTDVEGGFLAWRADGLPVEYAPDGARFADRIVVSAILVVTDERGRVLLVKQRGGPYAGHWMVPGGGVEPGERVADAAVRECREETGIEPSEVRHLATYDEHGAWEHGPFHVLLLAFRGHARGDPHGEDEAAWIDPRAIADPHPALLRVLVDSGLREGDPDTALANAGIVMERIER